MMMLAARWSMQMLVKRSVMLSALPSGRQLLENHPLWHMGIGSWSFRGIRGNFGSLEKVGMHVLGATSGLAVCGAWTGRAR